MMQMQMQEGRGMTNGTTPVVLTRTHRILIGVVVAGAVIIAAIGFAGSYAAVRELAVQKGFGGFSLVFPIGIDAGICVLLALDLLLTWLRIPFPLLRQTAWLLTAATIAFNGAASWPDPLGVGMHAVIPVLFVVSVEAARHAVGRIADITADKHMEGVRITRWLLSPLPTFLLWRRMKLWEIRSYEEAVRLEQHRLVYEAQLQARFGRRWRRKAPVESLMPLRLAKYGVPLAETAPHVLKEAGIVLSAVTDRADGQVSGGQQGGEHERALEGGEISAVGHAEEVRTAEPSLRDSVPEREHQDVPAVDYADACRAYIEQHGAFPDAGQLAAFLAQYGVTDPATGGLLAEAQLEPVLAELQQWMVEPETDDQPAGQAPAVVTDAAGDRGVSPVTDTVRQTAAEAHPFFGSAAPAAGESPKFGWSGDPEPYAAEQVPVPVATASAAGDRMPGGGVPQQTSLDVPTGVAAEAAAGEPAAWEATVTDTGAATARLPEQQTQEPDLDPVQQQIVTVAGWLAEAEDAGQKVSGAEVARRLGLSPKTGQRRVNAAAEHLEEQRRQQGRAHLRSVNR
ncbi:DUF2637 domain-containing protein [Streptomyces sp. NBC_01142]|uniref:DUF2637 domain-containing protein n=1 Tax=Streptomyces sp. NBC_01142 TaxID=2975865 RepID=UPI0022535DBE|nr:DUF2637 domain-containing protein [Streptomyces sp. NBC_01142]MCX4826171.1 DUF2637 domain-containing protein [Streptomyces sp. NBC_01142]